MKLFDFIFNNIGVFFACIVGSGFFFTGLKIFLEIYRIKKKGISTYGEIIRYDSEFREAKYSDETDTIFYFPIVKFIDLQNNVQEIKIDIGTNQKPKYRTPYKTKLYYIKEKSNYKVITESRSDILLTYFLMGLGFLIFSVPLFYLFI